MGPNTSENKGAELEKEIDKLFDMNDREKTEEDEEEDDE